MANFCKRIGLTPLVASLLTLTTWLMFDCALANAQSGTRPTEPMVKSGSGTRPLVAAPQAKHTSPFLPSVDRELSLPLALRGFCSVTLRDQQTWADGEENYQHIFDGQIYWFVSRREQAIFAANPIRYVPVLRGDCVVTFAESGKRSPGDPQFGILHNQRLYFFKGDAEFAKFRASPEQFIAADLKFGGNCVVCRIEDQRDRLGMPETTVIVNGLRYQFAGAHQKHRFLQNMLQYGVARERTDSKALASPAPGSLPDTLAEQVAEPVAETKEKDHLSRAALGKKAMGGYCPVTIRNQGQWVKGDARHAEQFDGQAYFMASESEQALFREDPQQFIPALGGHCVVTEMDENRRVPGNIYHAAFHESEERLFLFAGSEQKLAFSENTEKYLNADLALNGMCVVSLVDEQREVEGRLEFLTWHANKRYLFASAEKKAKFDENISLYQEF